MVDAGALGELLDMCVPVLGREGAGSSHDDDDIDDDIDDIDDDDDLDDEDEMMMDVDGREAGSGQQGRGKGETTYVGADFYEVAVGVLERAALDHHRELSTSSKFQSANDATAATATSCRPNY